MKSLHSIGLIGLSFFWTTSLYGQALTVTVTSPEDPNLTITLTGNDVAGIFDQAISRENELEAFTGLEIEANLNYLGVDEAIVLDIAPDGTSAELSIPSTGHTQTFNAESTSALEDEIEDYIKEDGSSEIAKFRKENNKQSPVGITDGSPSSTTASVADSFYRIASPFGPIGSESSGWSLSLESSDWTADNLEGENTTLRLNKSFRTGENSQLRLSAPLETRKIGEAEIFGGGLVMAWNHRLKQPEDTRGLYWNATPLLGLAGRGSEDLAAGGLIWSYGVNSSTYYKFNDKQAIAFIAQYNGFEGIPVDYDEFELDHDIQQSMLKTGLQWQTRVAGALTVRLGWTASKFLDDAAIDSFNTTKLGLAFPLSQKADLSLAFSQTSGGSYESNAVSASLNW